MIEIPIDGSLRFAWLMPLAEAERCATSAARIRELVAADTIGAAHPDALWRAQERERQAEQLPAIAVLEWLLWSGPDAARFIGGGLA